MSEGQKHRYSSCTEKVGLRPYGGVQWLELPVNVGQAVARQDAEAQPALEIKRAQKAKWPTSCVVEKLCGYQTM